jgi:hypothetical protein
MRKRRPFIRRPNLGVHVTVHVGKRKIEGWVVGHIKIDRYRPWYDQPFIVSTRRLLI